MFAPASLHWLWVVPAAKPVSQTRPGRQPDWKLRLVLPAASTCGSMRAHWRFLGRMGRGAGVEPDPQPEVPQLPSAKRQSPSASQIAGGAGLNSTAVRGQEVLKALQNDDVLEQLKQITQEGPTKVAVLGTRFCTYLHQPVIELLSYALVLSGNRVITSGSQGTNACVIRGALRAQKPHLLTVILPQGFGRQERRRYHFGTYSQIWQSVVFRAGRGCADSSLCVHGSWSNRH